MFARCQISRQHQIHKLKNVRDRLAKDGAAIHLSEFCQPRVYLTASRSELCLRIPQGHPSAFLS
jgi:hypothetical protein